MPARPPTTFSDSDWTRDPPHPPLLPPPQRRALTFAVAIALGCVGLAFVFYGIERWFDAQSRAAAAPVHGGRVVPAAAPPGASAVAPATVPSAPAAAAVASTTPAPAAADTERRELAALEAEMKQRAREAAEQAAADAVRRKERAWERFYQRPAFCNENPTSAQMIECANQYIRARKTFEERYGSGRL